MKELDDIFNTTDEQDLKFEEMVINSDMMHIIQELMILNGIKNKAELADKLGVSKPYITKLFSGDKSFNVTLLAKLQRIFKTKIVFSAKCLQKNIEESDEMPIQSAKIIKLKAESILSPKIQDAYKNYKFFNIDNEKFVEALTAV